MPKLPSAIAASTATLFLWGGVTQVFPWGPSSAHVVTSRTTPPPSDFHLRPPVAAEPGSLATPAFDEAFSGRLGMLFTDRTISWISSMPIEYYDGTGYLLRQAGTQLVVAALLVALLLLLAPLSARRRLGIVALAAGAGGVATYGVLANWWGLAPAYALGEGANLVAGWTLAALAAMAVLRRRGPRTGGRAHG